MLQEHDNLRNYVNLMDLEIGKYLLKLFQTKFINKHSEYNDEKRVLGINHLKLLSYSKPFLIYTKQKKLNIINLEP